MKQSTRFMRLYLPSYEEIPPWHVSFLKVWATRVSLAILAWLAVCAAMETVLRIRGW